MNSQARGDEQPVERGAAEEASGSPLTETEADAARQPPGRSDDDGESSTQDDGSGMAGGSSGGSGGGSGMAGHPDATR